MDKDDVGTAAKTKPLPVGKHDNAATCGLVWAANSVAYRCRTCAVSPSMSLCSKCFQRGNHEGHDFYTYRSSSGGFCDCGDKSFMRESGFCQRHGARNQLDKPEVPANLLAVAEVLMPQLFQQLFQHMRDNREPVLKKDNAPICGLVRTANSVAYRCDTCAVSHARSLCSACFENGDHEGHDFYKFRSPSEGFRCVCGDESFMFESEFCPWHGTRNEIDKPAAAANLLTVAEVLMPRLLQQLIPLMRGNAVKKMQEDLKSLLTEGEDSDVTFKVQEKEFRAHRSILKARSAVFKSMFSHDTAENQTGKVTICDCDSATFPDFLNYVYTGSTENLSAANVWSLYAAADKYCMDALKEECLMFMKNNLSVESFCDFVTLALLHEEEELVELATSFFSEHMLEIIETAKWETFLHENTKAGNEILIKATSK